MTYESAVDALYELGHELAGTPSHKFDLAHMRALLEAAGHPERRFASVLIAGTNGKGSTAATLASILHTAGYKTALYTSPHLVRINERIRIDGKAIGDAEFARCLRAHRKDCARISGGEEAAMASKLFRDAHRHGLRALCTRRSADRGPGSRHGWPPRRYQRRRTAGFGDHRHFARSPEIPRQHHRRDRRRKSRHHQAARNRGDVAATPGRQRRDRKRRPRTGGYRHQRSGAHAACFSRRGRQSPR